jgi:hypothetical protein
MARDIKQDLVTFLRTYIDETSITVSFDSGNPSKPNASGGVRFADYDGENEYPQIAIASEDPSVSGGGQSRYSGIDAGGRGGIQDVITSVQIDCWGGPDTAEVYQTEGSHPDVVANELGREVHRVLFEADEAAEGPPVPDGYEWVNAEPPTESNDTNRSPTHYRRVVIGLLKHTERP